MRVVLFAAGKGTRISRHLDGRPKCSVEINKGVPLIKYTINMWKKHGVNDITLITGYNHTYLEKLLKDSNITFVNNPFYDVTNSIASAYFAKNILKNYDETVFMNADVFLEEGFFRLIIDEKQSPIMYADDRRKEEGDYKFKYANNILEKYGKELSGEDITGEYIGLAKISKEHLPKFIMRLNEMIENQIHNVWWENVLYSFVGKENIYIKTINDLFWAEVDYIEDYERIIDFCKYSL